jgi:tetratricopeptide (TPR) repeat protein
MRSTTKAVLAALALASTACKTGGEHPAVEGATPASVTDGETDVKQEPQQDQNELAKVPMTLWSPAQRRSTASYYYLVAEYVAMKEHDAKKALSLFEAAYSLDPNPFLGGKMLAAKAAAGDRSEALLDARKMVLLYPRDAELRFFYGDMLAQGGNPQEATEQLEKCVELNPHDEAAYLELTEVYQTLKQTGRAMAVAKDLVKNVPSSVAGWSQLSRLYLINSRYKDALVPARRAWEMQSTNPQLTQIYAIALQLNGKTKQAVAIYEQLYRMDPTDEELMGRMVELYRQLGNLSQALDMLDEMAKVSSQARPAVQMQKAILLWELKRNEEASTLLDKLVKDFPQSDRVRYLAAYGHERMEQTDKALSLYQSIAADSPLKKEAEYREVVLLKDKKRVDEALALGEKLLQDESVGWEAYGVVAGVYSDSNRQEDAIRTVANGYQKHPDKPRLLFLKGVYQEKAGDRDGCIKTMREVIDRDPENSSAFNYLGYLFAEKGENLDEAEKLISRALELKPNDGFYLDSLGWVHFQKGEYDKAQPLLEKAAKLEPKEGVIFEHLGDVKKAKGDKAAAHQLYEQALKATLEDKDRERIEKKAKESA